MKWVFDMQKPKYILGLETKKFFAITKICKWFVGEVKESQHKLLNHANRSNMNPMFYHTSIILKVNFLCSYQVYSTMKLEM